MLSIAMRKKLPNIRLFNRVGEVPCQMFNNSSAFYCVNYRALATTGPHIVIIKAGRQRSSLTLTAASVYHKVIPVEGPGGISNSKPGSRVDPEVNSCIFLGLRRGSTTDILNLDRRRKKGDALRVLSGNQPSGSLHIGNYLGMMKPMLSYMNREELFVFIVNYHALTSVNDREKLATGTLEAAADLHGFGPGPDRCFFLGPIGCS